jgi:F-type H+-transporting ATPase subunit b
MRALLPLALLAAALAAAPAHAADEHGHAAPAAHHAATDHAATEGEHAEHGAHGGHHVPTFDDINWFYGAFGEKDGVEPDFLFRPTGMPAPFGLWILNAVVLYGFLIKVARPKVREGLKNRKTSILRGMDEAARMKREAEARLADYEEKLERIEHEVERVRREMREGAEAERARILSEAKTRRVRMEEDAKILVAQELSAATASLREELIKAALTSAVAMVKSRLRPEDHQRYADEFLSGLGPARTALRGRA